MSLDHQERSTAGLFADALQHLTNLVRGEIALAKAEVEQNVKRAARGVAMIAVAAIALIITLGLGSAAAVLGLVEYGFTPFAASLICAGIFALVALILGWVGLNAISNTNLKPDQTVRNIKRDALKVKETFSHEHVH